MANKKSSKKDIRRTLARTERNKAVGSRIKTLAKNAAKTGEAKDASLYVSAVDKAAKTGLVHRNKVARIKSRLAKKAAVKTA